MSKVSSRKKNIALCIAIPVVCCIIFAIFCMLNLKSSIWFDESYSAYLVRGDFSDIWSMTGRDVHPPLFYFLLKIWSSIFGYTDFSMRFMSIFFGALGIIFTFQLLKRWFNVKTASIATLALSLSPMLIRYGQEMRMYTLVFFIVVAATYVLDLMLETKKTRYHILYAVLISLGMWTHYFTAIAWIAHIVYYKVTKRAKIFEKRMIWTYVLAVALFLPWMPSLIKQVLEVESSGFWIPAVSLATPADYLSQSLMFSEAEYAVGWLVLIALTIVIFTTVFLSKAYKTYNKTERSKFWLIITLVIVPPIILIMLSLPPLTSMFIDRYILYSAAYIWVLIGLALTYAFSSIKKGKAASIVASLVFLAGVIGCAVTGLVNVENRRGEGYVKNNLLAVQMISEDNIPILTNNEWNYYDAVFYSTDKHPIYGVNDWINYYYGSIYPIERLGYNLIYDLNDFTNDHDKIWYFTNLNDQTRTGELDKEELSSKYRVLSTIADDRSVVFELEKK